MPGAISAFQTVLSHPSARHPGIRTTPTSLAAVGHIPIRPDDRQAAPRNLLRYCACTRGRCSDIANVCHSPGLLQLPAARSLMERKKARKHRPKRPQSTRIAAQNLTIAASQLTMGHLKPHASLRLDAIPCPRDRGKHFFRRPASLSLPT